MTSTVKNKPSGFIRTALAVITLAALIAFALPQGAQAATSGGATIYNTAKVSYTSGSTTTFSAASVSLTVNTVGAAPTFMNPAGQTVAAGAAVTYLFGVKSNSNGPDTYTPSALTNTATGVGAASGASLAPLPNFTLWGGITVGASGAGTITVPFGTAPAVNTIIQIGATNQYTVTAIAAGSAASTNASGNLVAEVPATLTLTIVGSAPAITAGSVATGTQVGEVKTVTALFTAGTPTLVGTDGSYSTVFTVTPLLIGTGTVDPTGVTTVVTSPKVTITKTASPIGTVNPGGTITYTIIVTNTSTTGGVTGVSLTDAVPAYTTYVANSTRLNAITVAGDGGPSPLAAGLAIDNNAGRGAGLAATGNIPASGVATITYQVTVQ
jgi:uncharacterized repeat protein (TIGR01451 family)